MTCAVYIAQSLIRKCCIIATSDGPRNLVPRMVLDGVLHDWLQVAGAGEWLGAVSLVQAMSVSMQ